MKTPELCETCKKAGATQSVTTYSGYQAKVCEECYQSIKTVKVWDEKELRRSFLKKMLNFFK